MFIVFSFICFLFGILGLIYENGIIISIANMIWGFGYAINDGIRIKYGNVNALSVFAFFSGFVGYGNYMVIKSYLKGNYDYLSYGIPSYYTEAAFLNYLGTIFILFGGSLAKRTLKDKSFLPIVKFIPKNRSNTPWIIYTIGIISFLFIKAENFYELGKVARILDYIPVLAVFFTSRWGYSKSNKPIIWASFILSILISYDALLYAYLRGEIIMPWISFSLGGILGSPKIRTIKSTPFILVYIALIFFFSYFGMMAIVRSERVYGEDRIERLMQLKDLENKGDFEKTLQNPLARRSTVNKQSQIFHLVSRNSFYNGETLEYFMYVFIPRIVWPEKPIIAKGQWFAKQIGMGTILESGRFSNSINMTIPGELYLNFGWTGAIIGCLFVGFIFMIIWQSANFWGSVDNVTGSLLCFHLISRSIGNLGADMQSVIGFINTYIIFLIVSHIFKIIYFKKERKYITA